MSTLKRLSYRFILPALAATLFKLVRPSIDWLLQPCPAAGEPERRRARFLSILLVCLQGMVVTSLAAVLTFEAPSDPRRASYTSLLLALLILLALAGQFNRFGRYHAAVHLTMTCAVIGPWAAIFFDSSILHSDFVPPLYLGLSVVLATILLPQRATVLLAALQVGGFVWVLAIAPGRPTNWPSLLIFMLTLTLLSIVSSMIARQDIHQIEHQNDLLMAREAQLRELSVRDPLTGVFNRRYLEETLARELDRAGRKGQSLGIIMVDIDHFKRINDRYGHAMGDTVLRSIGAAFSSLVRGSDIVCRFGGEEFVFMLPEASLEVTQRRAEQIRAEVERLCTVHASAIIGSPTLSLGVAAYPQNGPDGAALLAAADAALYQAKRHGRNRVETAPAQPSQVQLHHN